MSKPNTGSPAVPPSSVREETARAVADAVLVPAGFRLAIPDPARPLGPFPQDVITPKPAITPPIGYRFAQFVKAVPFSAVNGAIDSALTVRIGYGVFLSGCPVAEIVESKDLGGSLEVVLAPDPRTGLVQRVHTPFSNVVGAVRV